MDPALNSQSQGVGWVEARTLIIIPVELYAVAAGGTVHSNEQENRQKKF